MLALNIDNGIKQMSVSELVSIFDELVDASQRFCQSLKRERNPCWLPLTEHEKSLGWRPLDKAKHFYQDFWYLDGQDGRETRSCFGIIAIDDEQLALVTQINDLKLNFKKAIDALKRNQRQAWTDVRKDLGQRHPLLREQLHYSGLTRLHLKQTWRTLPVIDRTITRIGFNWYQSGRSIQKITVQQAYDALSKMDTSSRHIQTQMSQLGRLASTTPLAKVQTLAPVMRANIFYEEAPSRQAMNVSLPLLIHGNQGLPAHNIPDMEPPAERQRARRSDFKIEEEAFLPSIRVHRYVLTSKEETQ